MRNQRGSIQLVIIGILLLVGLVVGVYLVQQKTNFLPKAAVPNPSTSQSASSQTIQNGSNLTKASTDLDNTDLGSIDNVLNQNDIDASNF